MKSVCHGGDVATLKELIDYEEKTVAKKEIASNESVRLILMAFDDDEALSYPPRPRRRPPDCLRRRGRRRLRRGRAQAKGRRDDLL